MYESILSERQAGEILHFRSRFFFVSFFVLRFVYLNSIEQDWSLRYNLGQMGSAFTLLTNFVSHFYYRLVWLRLQYIRVTGWWNLVSTKKGLSRKTLLEWASVEYQGRYLLSNEFFRTSMRYFVREDPIKRILYAPIYMDFIDFLLS